MPPQHHSSTFTLLTNANTSHKLEWILPEAHQSTGRAVSVRNATNINLFNISSTDGIYNAIKTSRNPVTLERPLRQLEESYRNNKTIISSLKDNTVLPSADRVKLTEQNNETNLDASNDPSNKNGTKNDSKLTTNEPYLVAQGSKPNLVVSIPRSKSLINVQGPLSPNIQTLLRAQDQLHKKLRVCWKVGEGDQAPKVSLNSLNKQQSTTNITDNQNTKRSLILGSLLNRGQTQHSARTDPKRDTHVVRIPAGSINCTNLLPYQIISISDCTTVPQIAKQLLQKLVAKDPPSNKSHAVKQEVPLILVVPIEMNLQPKRWRHTSVDYHGYTANQESSNRAIRTSRTHSLAQLESMTEEFRTIQKPMQVTQSLTSHVRLNVQVVSVREEKELDSIARRMLELCGKSLSSANIVYYYDWKVRMANFKSIFETKHQTTRFFETIVENSELQQQNSLATRSQKVAVLIVSNVARLPNSLPSITSSLLKCQIMMTELTNAQMHAKQSINSSNQKKEEFIKRKVEKLLERPEIIREEQEEEQQQDREWKKKAISLTSDKIKAQLYRKSINGQKLSAQAPNRTTAAPKNPLLQSQSRFLSEVKDMATMKELTSLPTQKYTPILESSIAPATHKVPLKEGFRLLDEGHNTQPLNLPALILEHGISRAEILNLYSLYRVLEKVAWVRGQRRGGLDRATFGDGMRVMDVAVGEGQKQNQEASQRTSQFMRTKRSSSLARLTLKTNQTSGNLNGQEGPSTISWSVFLRTVSIALKKTPQQKLSALLNSIGGPSASQTLSRKQVSMLVGSSLKKLGLGGAPGAEQLSQTGMSRAAISSHNGPDSPSKTRQSHSPRKRNQKGNQYNNESNGFSIPPMTPNIVVNQTASLFSELREHFTKMIIRELGGQNDQVSVSSMRERIEKAEKGNGDLVSFLLLSG